MIKLLPLKAEDREQFITDNQEVFKFEALFMKIISLKMFI